MGAFAVHCMHRWQPNCRGDKILHIVRVPYDDCFSKFRTGITFPCGRTDCTGPHNVTSTFTGLGACTLLPIGGASDLCVSDFTILVVQSHRNMLPATQRHLRALYLHAGHIRAGRRFPLYALLRN